MDKWLLVQVKRTNGTVEKGVVVKDTLDAAKQSYHAYLGAYAYGNNANTDYVLVQVISAASGYTPITDIWQKTAEEQEEIND